MCTIDIGLVRQALQTTFIDHRQRSHMCYGKTARIMIGQIVICTIRYHRSVVHRTYCAANKRQRAVMMGIHDGTPSLDIINRISLCTTNSFTGNRMRPSAAFTSRFAGTMHVDQHMIFSRFRHHFFDELNRLLILGIKEVWFNAFDAHIRPLFKELLPIIIIGQISLSCPNNQADAFFCSILNQVGHPIIITFVFMFASCCIAARLPAFIQKLVFPTHFNGKINILFIVFQTSSFKGNAIWQLVVTEITIQPGPVHCSRLNPAGVLYLACRRQGLCQSIVGNSLQVANNDIAPWAGER